MVYPAIRTMDAVEDREDKTMTDGEHTGGCMCGALRYRVSGAPVLVGICHCETCRRNAGAPYQRDSVFINLLLDFPWPALIAAVRGICARALCRPVGRDRLLSVVAGE